jgi:2-methylisocitrate lyase-like PEP mutase family enzyme
VINARADALLWPYVAGAEPGSQLALVPDALARSLAYLEAGADCAYPIALWEPDALREFMGSMTGPVNVSWVPQLSSVADVAALGAARVSWAIFLYQDAMARFTDQLAALPEPH